MCKVDNLSVSDYPEGNDLQDILVEVSIGVAKQTPGHPEPAPLKVEKEEVK